MDAVRADGRQADRVRLRLERLDSCAAGARSQHGGGIFGFSTYALRLPDERVYVAVLCNSDSPSADPGYLAKKIAALAVGDPFPEPAAITLDPKVLERYAGVYRIDESSTRTVTAENGRLYTQRSGGERLEVRPSSETEFFYDKSLTRLRFVLDASGRATEMLFLPRGRGRAGARAARRRRAGRAHGGRRSIPPCTTPTSASTSSLPASSSP